MPLIRARHIPVVYHVGHLDRAPGDRRPSVDGPGIAVSQHPDDWRQIAGLNGPEHRLEYKPAQWLDALSFDDNDIREIVTWMINRDYMVPVTTWRVESYDDAKDDFVEFVSRDRVAAAARVGRSLEEEIEAADRGEGAVEVVEGYQLRPRAMARLAGVPNWPDPLRWFEAAILLYAREVVLEKRPFIVGVWWDEPREPKAGLSGYGVLFPERAQHFLVEDEMGVEHAFRDAFPECPGVPGPNDLEAQDRARKETYEKLLQALKQAS